jgi:hypothetical protein
MKEIACLVGVSLSSVSNWVRDVPLTNAQRAALRWRDPQSTGSAMARRPTVRELALDRASGSRR